MHRRLLVAPLALCAGCTIIFDADDLRHRDATPGIDSERIPDATPPDAIPIDADPSLLEVTGTDPTEIDEGIGGEGGRPALIKILGDSIAPDAVITAAFVEASVAQPVILETGVAFSQTSAIVSIQLPVLNDLDAGATRTLQFTVSQNGGATVKTVDMIVDGLDELTLTAGNRAVTTLSAKYSHIDVNGAVHFTGATPAKLVATGDINLSALIDVDGSGATGGVQGCAGGPHTMQGECMGGMPGASVGLAGPGAGGGGGGYGTAGTMGTTAGAVIGGAGGLVSGNDMLIPLATGGTSAGNRGSGGGGGGDGTLGNAGGPGGGGGGVILLQAGGDIVVTGTGGIRSQGGQGTGTKGGGGGGAGGAVLVRAGGTITSVAWLSAPGGSVAAGAANPGGAGGLGRIRVDAPDGDVTTMASNPAALRGPAWDDEVPVIVNIANPGFTMRGPPGRKLGVTLDGDAIGDFTIGTSGMKTIDADDAAELMLGLGLHELCVAYAAFDASPDTSTPEALSCVNVAYYPASP